MSEDQLRIDAARAMRAQQLLDNELLKEAFEGLRNNYIAKWTDTDVTQQDLREKYWLARRVVDVVQAHLSSIVSNGKMAAAELKALEEMAVRKKRFGVV